MNSSSTTKAKTASAASKGPIQPLESFSAGRSNDPRIGPYSGHPPVEIDVQVGIVPGRVYTPRKTIQSDPLPDDMVARINLNRPRRQLAS